MNHTTKRNLAIAADAVCWIALAFFAAHYFGVL